MSQILKKLPLPITGLMLGFAALGNLVQSYSNGLRNVFGLISGIILILVLAKIIMYPKGVKEALENPVVASVFPTLSMTIMLLATYLKPFIGSAAFAVWVIGVGLHVILMVWFTVKFVAKWNIKKVFASWFIVYVGIVVASVTAPAFEMLAIGQLAFWVGFVSYFVLIPIVAKRIFVVKEIPEPAFASIAISAAPGSLLLAGYINSFPEKNMFIVWLLLILSQVIFLGVLLYTPKLINTKFYPSFSSFTFPFVISGIGLKLTNGFLTKAGTPIPILGTLVKLEELIALVLCFYVLIKYVNFLLAKEAPAPTNKPA